MPLQGLYRTEWDMNSEYVRSDKEAVLMHSPRQTTPLKNVQTYTSKHDSLYTGSTVPSFTVIGNIETGLLS
jgi:hypothetical protein